MAQSQYTHSLVHLEEVVSVLFCLIDDVYCILDPRAEQYGSEHRLNAASGSALQAGLAVGRVQWSGVGEVKAPSLSTG